MATDKDIKEILLILAASYPRFTATDETCKAYTLFLKDIPKEELRAAAAWCATNKDFFPSVHELRQAVATLHRKASNLPAAAEAWEAVLHAHKPYELWANGGREWVEYQWPHPLVERVAKALGWPANFPGDDTLMADRAHFFKAWAEMVDDALVDEVTLPEVRAFIEGQKAKLLESGK